MTMLFNLRAKQFASTLQTPIFGFFNPRFSAWEAEEKKHSN